MNTGTEQGNKCWNFYCITCTASYYSLNKMLPDLIPEIKVCDAVPWIKSDDDWAFVTYANRLFLSDYGLTLISCRFPEFIVCKTTLSSTSLLNVEL